MDSIIERFKLYRQSHPNLSTCWLAYLELKKRHYDERLFTQCSAVLDQMARGCGDMKEKDIVGLLLYKRSI